MRAINKPRLNYADILQTCVNSIDSDDLSNRLACINTDLAAAAEEYTQKAPFADLYLIAPFNGKDNDIVAGSVTKGELKDLYTCHMVPAKKPARIFYDELKLLAHLNICPLCGFGQVSTLDHYLPKAKFPIVSVLPINLIPACDACNKKKGVGIAASKAEQSINPYFDHGHLIDEQWIFSKVNETSPASIKFEVNPPAVWSPEDKLRVEVHFTGFELPERFSIEAANELATLKEELQYDFDINGMAAVRAALQRKAAVAYKLHKNSWKTAMYQALASNDWYCNGGFAQG